MDGKRVDPNSIYKDPTPEEINDAVARKLGWKQAGPMKHDPLNVYLKKDGERIEGLPDYCHSIEAAWEVLESWKGHWELHRQNGHFDFILYRRSEQYDGQADTAPMAICLAFLKLI